MGANLQTRAFVTQDKTKIVQQWNTMVQNSLYEEGHCYSGGVGMLGEGVREWHDANFATEREASDWIAENQDKWDGAKACSFTNKKGEKCWLIGGWCSE